MKHTGSPYSLKARLQGLALRLRAVPGVSALWAFWYRAGIAAVLRLARVADRRAGGSAVRAVYLRRGGGRGELVPGASDLDFFLVLAALPAEREMELLKTFWRSYFRWRLLFPFLGEVLMGEEIELRQWLESPTVRSREARCSWVLLAGEESPGLMEEQSEPELRDIFSESLKCYWEQLEAVVKLRDRQFHAGLRPFDPGAIRLRNAAKATVDLFRLHHLATSHEGSEAHAPFWRATREELLTMLPASRYGRDLAALQPLLRLEGELFPEGKGPFELFSGLLHTSLGCLHELALALGSAEGEPGWSLGPGRPNASAVDRYSLSVRELFAERMLLRHSHFLSRAVLSEATTHLYFLLAGVPSLEDFRALLADLRDVSFSFDRFSLAMPLTEAAFGELERSSVFDTPFHAFTGHRESRLAGDGSPVTSSYSPPAAVLPSRMLAKTFAELSFVLRYPPAGVDYFLEKIVGLVLGLRVASEQNEIAAGFHSAWRSYSEKYPDRAAQLGERLAPCLYRPSEKEAAAWEDVFESLARFDELEPGQGRHLRAQLERLRLGERRQAASPTLATDLWINLTPFLRMEMAALKERYFHHRGRMKV